MAPIYVSSGLSDMNSFTASIDAFRDVFRRIIYSSLGRSAGEAVMLLLREIIRRDPIEVLWENPKAVYDEMVKIFGEGTKVLISILVSNINKEYGLNMSPERFLELMRDGSQNAVEEMRSLIESVAKARRRE